MYKLLKLIYKVLTIKISLYKERDLNAYEHVWMSGHVWTCPGHVWTCPLYNYG